MVLVCHTRGEKEGWEDTWSLKESWVRLPTGLLVVYDQEK
jgi:hypothetical protein